MVTYTQPSRKGEHLSVGDQFVFNSDRSQWDEPQRSGMLLQTNIIRRGISPQSGCCSSRSQARKLVLRC